MARYVDRTAAHQIRITTEPGHVSHLMVGCVCGAPKVRSVDGAHDHWAIYNTLTHDEARAAPSPGSTRSPASPSHLRRPHHDR